MTLAHTHEDNLGEVSEGLKTGEPAFSGASRVAPVLLNVLILPMAASSSGGPSYKSSQRYFCAVTGEGRWMVIIWSKASPAGSQRRMTAWETQRASPELLQNHWISFVNNPEQVEETERVSRASPCGLNVQGGGLSQPSYVKKGPGTLFSTKGKCSQ